MLDEERFVLLFLNCLFFQFISFIAFPFFCSSLFCNVSIPSPRCSLLFDRAQASLPGFEVLPLRQFGSWGPEITSKFDPQKDTYVLVQVLFLPLKIIKFNLQMMMHFFTFLFIFILH